MKTLLSAWIVAAMVLTLVAWAQLPPAPPYSAPDARYKADILVVVAHPDDDMAAAAYVARAVDAGKRAAVIFCTRGNSGSNYAGDEQAAALGAIRDIEGREAEATLGVHNVWFLDGSDTPGQDVLHSLEAWGHGRALEQVVRLVRLTRPEVIMTWLPDYVAGENHDDHQAAGVLATQAFDLAGDSLAFPEQVEAPRNAHSISNYGEGLRPWQPQKIYYFTDASHREFLAGKGPQYNNSDLSPSRHISYGELTYEAFLRDKSQISPGFTPERVKAFLARPVQYILGKSVVGGSPTGDILENVKAEGVPWVPVMGHHAVAGAGEGLQLGGPWAFYRDFWAAHNLEHLANLLAPETAMGSGDFHLWVPLILHNTSGIAEEVSLRSSLPAGWTQTPEPMMYSLAAHESRPVSLFLVAPQDQKGSWQTLTFTAEAGGSTVGTVTLKANVVYNGVPQ